MHCEPAAPRHPLGHAMWTVQIDHNQIKEFRCVVFFSRLGSLPLLITVLGAQTATAPVQPAPAKRPLTELPYTPGLDVTSLDRTTDPCVDFYTFSCGNWQARNPIPPIRRAGACTRSCRTRTSSCSGDCSNRPLVPTRAALRRSRRSASSSRPAWTKRRSMRTGRRPCSPSSRRSTR